MENPGSLMVSQEQLRRGGVSLCRNKSLQRMFMLIGACDQAGAGLRRIQDGWASQLWPEPRLSTHTQPDRIRLDFVMRGHSLKQALLRSEAASTILSHLRSAPMRANARRPNKGPSHFTRNRDVIGSLSRRRCGSSHDPSAWFAPVMPATAVTLPVVAINPEMHARTVGWTSTHTPAVTFVVARTAADAEPAVIAKTAAPKKALPMMFMSSTPMFFFRV